MSIQSICEMIKIFVSQHCDMFCYLLLVVSMLFLTEPKLSYVYKIFRYGTAWKDYFNVFRISSVDIFCRLRSCRNVAYRILDFDKLNFNKYSHSHSLYPFNFISFLEKSIFYQFEKLLIQILTNCY